MTSAALQQFTDAAKSLEPQIRASAEESEQTRRLSLPLIKAIAQAGLFRLWRPRSLGGEEVDAATAVRVIEEVSRIDGTTGWCLAIGSNTSLPSGYLPAQAARDIYGSDPDLVTAALGRPWAKPLSQRAVTVPPAGGRSPAAVSIQSGSRAAAGSSKAISRACGRTARQSRVSCSSAPLR
jgi:alkylation response protein AidB-like acyl-CoA dehydrogenase